MSFKSRFQVLAAVGAVGCMFILGTVTLEIVAPTLVAAETNRRVERVQARALKDSCRTVRAIRGGEIWKSIASTHIPRSDPRRNSTSFITLRGVTAPRGGSCLPLYDGKGNRIHSLGQYFPSGAKYSSRFYGGHGCGDKKSAASVASLARRNTGNTTVYLGVGGGQCIQLSSANRCFNSAAC